MAIAAAAELLRHAGLAEAEIGAFVDQVPPREWLDDRFSAAADTVSRYLEAGQTIRARLPRRPARTVVETDAIAALDAELRDARVRFVRRFARPLYDALTNARQELVRVEDLVCRAADRVPGLSPTRAEIAAERTRAQQDKEGAEIDQGLLLGQLLSDPDVGSHLIHAMLRPLPESVDLLPELRRTGRVSIGSTLVTREGPVGIVTHGNPRFLNAEDDATTRTLEMATDLVLLDPDIELAVLRGQVVDHPKYAGRRVFNAGVNLTDLAAGRISFIDFFVVRDMGYLHKIYRGLSGPEFWPTDVEPSEHDKPWLAAVETFAIGGGCQLLLVMDHVLAEQGSAFTLPARKEGIIPGLANLRLWRFVGDRRARQAIQFDESFAADSPAGRLLCDTLVPAGEMDRALAHTIAALTSSGVVSATANRKALRLGQESLEQFRQYLAMYCREQVRSLYSPRLIANLETHWRPARRQPVPMG